MIVVRGLDNGDLGRKIIRKARAELYHIFVWPYMGIRKCDITLALNILAFCFSTNTPFFESMEHKYSN